MGDTRWLLIVTVKSRGTDEAIAAVKQSIEDALRNKGIFEQETRGSTFEKQLFEGFPDPDAEKLRGEFIRLNQFHESWIPGLEAIAVHSLRTL